MPVPTSVPATADAAIADTRRWIERAVIGLNLCPFAKAVVAKGQVHYAVCDGADPSEVLAALDQEAKDLVAHDAEERDTTLLLATACLHDFLDFNDFVGRAERLLAKRGLAGELQLATFHPGYQFGGTTADDITNATNRAPWPTLHLLREASIDRAVEAFPEAEAIFGRNMDTLERLGSAGWDALDVGPGAGARLTAVKGHA
ncbi:MAG: DUF1415 domain-containing protein [Pseudomonadota bacterium]